MTAITATPLRWQTTRFTLDLHNPVTDGAGHPPQVAVMGIVNTTPDSFSDGGQPLDAAAALRRCETLLTEGAQLLDIGGESTRPGAPEVPADEEWRRVQPVLKTALSLGVPVSVDTRKPAVMRAALDLGVDIVNDVQALSHPDALAALAAHPAAGVCLMHMRGTPATMSQLAVYDDVVAAVRQALAEARDRCLAAGLHASRLVLDPGYGFAKQPAHSWQLLAGQAALATLGRPLLVGLSRKGLLGAATGRPVQQRQAASVAAAVLALERGAHVLRVHDVAATVDAVRVWQALHQARSGAHAAGTASAAVSTPATPTTPAAGPR